MVGNRNEVTIHIKGDSKSAERSLGRVQASMKRVSDRARAMRGPLLGIAAAAIGGLGVATKMAEEQRQGIALLDASLRQVNTSYEAQSVAIEKVVESLQRKTNFGDETQRESLQKLIALSGDYENSLKALPVVLDLATALHINLESAANLVGRGLSGNTELFSRYGIEIEAGASATQLLTKLTDQFAGAAEAAASPVVQLKNRMGDAAQTIGFVLLPMVNGLASGLEVMIRKFTEAPPIVATVVVGIGLAAASLAVLGLILPPVTAGILGLTAAFIAVRTAIIGVNTAGLVGMAAAFAGVAAVLAPVIGALAAVAMGFENALITMQNMGRGMRGEALLPTKQFHEILFDIEERIDNFVNGMDTMGGSLSLTGTITNAVTEAVDLLSEALETTQKTMGGTIDDAEAVARAFMEAGRAAIFFGEAEMIAGAMGEESLLEFSIVQRGVLADLKATYDELALASEEAGRRRAAAEEAAVTSMINSFRKLNAAKSGQTEIDRLTGLIESGQEFEIQGGLRVDIRRQRARLLNAQSAGAWQMGGQISGTGGLTSFQVEDGKITGTSQWAGGEGPPQIVIELDGETVGSWFAGQAEVDEQVKSA